MSESGQFLDAKVTLVKWIFPLVSVNHTAEANQTKFNPLESDF